MSEAKDFHLYYDNENKPKLSVSIGHKKSKAIRINKAFANMLETYYADVISFHGKESK